MRNRCLRSRCLQTQHRSLTVRLQGHTGRDMVHAWAPILQRYHHCNSNRSTTKREWGGFVFLAQISVRSLCSAFFFLLFFQGITVWSCIYSSRYCVSTPPIMVFPSIPEYAMLVCELRLLYAFPRWLNVPWPPSERFDTGQEHFRIPRWLQRLNRLLLLLLPPGSLPFIVFAFCLNVKNRIVTAFKKCWSAEKFIGYP